MTAAADWSARLILGDCIEAMQTLEPESIDAVVCDPPYGIEFMGKDWDSFGANKARIGRGGSLKDGNGGDRWEKPRPQAYIAGVAFQQWCEEWAGAVYRILKPGGHLLAFGGTRTYHRLAVGLEDADFEIRDSIHWMYGSGFPKSRDISKAIDAHLDVERPVIGQATGIDPIATRPGFAGAAHSRVPNQQKTYDLTGPGSEEAAQWEGWGTGLKPAHEPVVLARKPFIGTVAENVMEYGTAGLNVTATRVGETGGQKAGPRPTGEARKRASEHASTSFPPQAEYTIALDAGRWPANVVLSHSPDCKGNGATNTDVLCVPGCPVAALNAAVAGSASFYYIAKPRTRERVGGTMRNLHPTVKPIDMMRYLVRLITPPGGIVLDPFLGSGTTGCAAMAEGFRFVGIEKEQESFDTSLARIADYAFAHGRPRPTTS